MRDFKNDHPIIRQFLLGQLSDDNAQAMEDRIFAEADFAEEVQIVENELITDFCEGNLEAEERALFDTRYSRDKTGQMTLEYEKVFGEFLRSKCAENLSSSTETFEPSESVTFEPSESVTSQSTESRLPTAQISVPPAYLKSPPPVSLISLSQQSSPWFRSNFTTNRLFAYAAIATVCLLSAAVVWYLIANRTAQPDNPLGLQVQAIEARLARLNTRGAVSPEMVLLTVNLQPAERDRGAMARIAADNKTPDGLIEFHLSLTEVSSQEYRAVFLNDRHQELFSISKLTAQRTTEGPEIRIVVPAAYLSPGDYQINLSVSNTTGGRDDVNSYAVRVAANQ